MERRDRRLWGAGLAGLAFGLVATGFAMAAPQAAAPIARPAERMMKVDANGDGVVDQTFPVIGGIQFDIEQIERQVFSGDSAAPERIYRLSREAIDLQHATNPLIPIIAALRAGSAKHQVPPELQAYLVDVADHLARISSQITDIRELLTQILTVNATLVDQRSNEDLKIISGWAAILVVPTLIGSIYGMNFDNMPELHHKNGYYFTLGLMVLIVVITFIYTRRKKW